MYVCHGTKHFINHSNLVGGIVHKNKKKHLKQTKQPGAVCSIKESSGCQLEHKTLGCQMW